MDLNKKRRPPTYPFSLVVIGLLLLNPLALAAHDGHRVFGVVQSVEGDTLILRSREGQIWRVQMAPRTRIEGRSGPATRDDLRPGRRVVVYLSPDHNQALRIRLGPPVN